MIAIVNYGVGNLGSIFNMLRKAGSTDVVVTESEQEIRQASRIILPGVGSFDAGMEKINGSGLLDALNEAVLVERKPLLGICLGMQLLTKGSEEGRLPGIGWIDAYTHRFAFEGEDTSLKVPHMGWNEVRPMKENGLIGGIGSSARFYFVHSYYVRCANPDDVLLSCRYGIDFTCAVQHGNIMGVQFHPEKSHKFGMQILRNFASITC